MMSVLLRVEDFTGIFLEQNHFHRGCFAGLELHRKELNNRGVKRAFAYRHFLRVVKIRCAPALAQTAVERFEMQDTSVSIRTCVAERDAKYMRLVAVDFVHNETHGLIEGRSFGFRCGVLRKAA